MIDKTTWKVGGNSSVPLLGIDRPTSPKAAYTNEITSPSTQVTSTYESKVGLMYISDYAFAAAPNAWTTRLSDYNDNDVSGNKITEENWMYMGLDEWTMTRTSDASYYACYVVSTGRGYVYFVDGDSSKAVRPVFHLTSKVEVLSGDGTYESPLKISAGA